MKTILITGISGFVGGHLAKYLTETKKDVTIHGISRSEPRWDFVPAWVRENLVFHQANLLDPDGTARLLKRIDADRIIHLAAFSSVARSWHKPVESFLNNASAFLNLVEAVRTQDLDCNILSVGSSEEYGVVSEDMLPLTEVCRTAPANPYAVARVSQEHLALIYAQGFKLNICCTRSFNHIGPGQTQHFVVSSIAKRFSEIKHAAAPPVITIGDGGIIRDFTDIQDVVAAYDGLGERGESGQTYNVCSGRGSRIIDIVDMMSNISGVDVSVEQNVDLMRPIDNPVLIGNYEKLQTRTGWRPQVPLERSLKNVYDYWSNKLVKETV